MRLRPIQQHHCSLCAGLFLQRERVWWSRTASLTGSTPLPASAPWASAGFGWWRRDVAPARVRGVLHVQAQARANRQGAVINQSAAEGSPQRRAQQAGEFEAGAGAGTASPTERRHHCDDHDLHRLAATHGAGVFSAAVRKKLTLRRESEKTDGERVYRIVAGKTSGDAADQPSA